MSWQSSPPAQAALADMLEAGPEVMMTFAWAVERR